MLQVIPKIIIRHVPDKNCYQILEAHIGKIVVIDEYCNDLQQAKDKYFSWKYAKSSKEYEFVHQKDTGDYLLTRRYGYHVAEIKKGVFGEPSKIVEEVLEFQDAVDQGVSVMAIFELSDLMGAVEAYLCKHHPTIQIEDLIRMKDVTKRAFSNGYRN